MINLLGVDIVISGVMSGGVTADVDPVVMSLILPRNTVNQCIILFVFLLLIL